MKPIKSLFILILLLFIQPSCLRADQLLDDTRQLAEQGDEEAQFSMGLRYDTGDGVERNPQQAVQWFNKAAKAGVAGACLYLGMKYEFGAGVSQNRKTAIHWYKKAAVQGWTQAAFLLGTLHLKPPKPDQVQGCAWLQIAAEQGYPGATETNQLKCSKLNKRTTKKIEKLVKKLQK